MLRRRVGSGVCQASSSSRLFPPPSLQCARRSNLLEHRTKGSPHMKHLDLYARRDPQLAPYLLREVDIEYKRKCRKASFLVWVVILTMGVALQWRIQAESVHHLRHYAVLVKMEEEGKDEDSLERRTALVGVMDLVVQAFHRDQRWGRGDVAQAKKVLRQA